MSNTAWVAGLDRQVPDAVARLLTTVPEWFAQPVSNEEYVEAARSKEAWTVATRMTERPAVRPAQARPGDWRRWLPLSGKIGRAHV